MMKDSRRIVGPEGSMAYSAFVAQKDNPKIPCRGEARAIDSHRKVFLKTGVISQAKGSAYLEQGCTKLMVGVYGPREVAHKKDFSMKGQLTAELKFAPFACQIRRDQQADSEEEELSLVVAEALSSTVCLHRYPKTCIEVFITVLEDDGGVLAAALTASGLALADAGIHMFDLVIGATISKFQDKLLIDPERNESYQPGGQVTGEVTVGLLPSLEQIVAYLAEGQLSTDEIASILAVATEQIALLLPAIQQCLVDKVKKKKTIDAQP